MIYAKQPHALHDALSKKVEMRPFACFNRASLLQMAELSKRNI